MPWEQAVRLLPSIDTPDVRDWLATHGSAGALIVPADGCPPILRDPPHLEICIPPLEYALFATVLSARPLPPAVQPPVTARPPDTSS